MRRGRRALTAAGPRACLRGPAASTLAMPAGQRECFFPLQLPLGYAGDLREGVPSRRSAQREARRAWWARRVEQSISALNALAEATAARPLVLREVVRSSNSSPLEEAVAGRLAAKVSRCGPRPGDLHDDEALRALLKSTDLYSEEGRATTEPFEWSRVKLLQGTVRPRSSLEVVPPHVAEVLGDPGQYDERPSSELKDDDHVEPYWGPLLDPGRAGNRSRLVQLLRRLREMGMVVAVERKKAEVGLFFATKKTGALRMIVDGRQPNLYHRLPPHASMASVEALAAVHVEGPWRSGRGGYEGVLRGASVDLKDGFHQFLNPQVAPWFSFGLRGLTAGELGVAEMIDENGHRVPVDAGRHVWAAYGGMAMGWSWALWVCNETLMHTMGEVMQPEDGWILDKGSAPDVRNGVGLAPYFDNANFVGMSGQMVQCRLDHMTRALDTLGLVWHEKVDSSDEVEILGVIVDGRRGADPRQAVARRAAVVRRGRAASTQACRGMAGASGGRALRVGVPARAAFPKRVPRHV